MTSATGKWISVGSATRPETGLLPGGHPCERPPRTARRAPQGRPRAPGVTDGPSHTVIGGAATFHPSPLNSSLAGASLIEVENPAAGPATARAATPPQAWKIPSRPRPPRQERSRFPSSRSRVERPVPRCSPGPAGGASRILRRAATATRETRGCDPGTDPCWKIAGHSVPPLSQYRISPHRSPTARPLTQCRRSAMLGTHARPGQYKGGGGGIPGIPPPPCAACRAARPHSTAVERHMPAARLICPRYLRTVPSR